MYRILFCHQAGYFIGKGDRIIRHDAFQEQCLIVEEVAVVLEGLAVFTLVVDGRQFAE